MPPTAMTTCFSPLLFSRGVAWPALSLALPLATALPFAGKRSCLLMYSDETSRRTGLACLDRAIAAAMYR